MFRRLLWFMCGIDLTEELAEAGGVLSSERRKYNSLGLSILVMTFIALFSFFFAFKKILYPETVLFSLNDPKASLYCGFLAIFLTLVFFNLQRFVLTISHSTVEQKFSSTERRVSGLAGLLLSLVMAMAVGIPLQSLILEAAIEAAWDHKKESLENRYDDMEKNRADELVDILRSWQEFHGKTLSEIGEPSSIQQIGGCYEKINSCRKELEDNIKSAQAEILAGGGITNENTLTLRYQVVLFELQIQKLNAYKIQLEPLGLFSKSKMGFEIEPLFSWLILLTVFFLQMTPGIVRMLSYPSCYEYLMIERGRLLAAQHGIELGSSYVNGKDGQVIDVDVFHEVCMTLNQARSSCQKREEKVLVELKRQRLARLSELHEGSDSYQTRGEESA